MKNSKFIFTVLLGLVVLIILRRPEFLTEPRMWAEEGKFYFSHAYSSSFWDMLFFIDFGYYNLWANLVGYAAATFASLENAPLVTTSLALVAQLLPPVLILTSRSEYWTSTWQRVLAILLIMFMPCMGEVWLTSICSQYFFAVDVFLILLDRPDLYGRAGRWFQRGVLFLAGLSGAMAAFLTPFYLWDAWKTRSRERWVQAALMVTISAIHVAFILYVMLNKPGQMNNRFSGMSGATFFMAVWNRTIMVPVLGGAPAQFMLEWFPTVPRIAYHLSGAAALFATIGLTWFLLKGAPVRLRVLLVGSWLWVVTLNINASIDDKNSLIGPIIAARYFLAPAVFYLFIVLWNCKFPARSRRARLAVVLVVLSLLSGLSSWRSSLYWDPTWPKWRDEVAKWRADPAQPIAIWPPGWTMTLLPNR